MKLRLKHGLALLCAVVMGSVAACSSSSATHSSSTFSTSRATGSTWVVGSIGSFSGDFAASLGPGRDALTAWSRWTNAHGGINGHPIKLIVIDDKADPALALAGAKKLVDEDHVIALIGDASVVDSAWAGYVKSKGVPVLGYVAADQFANSDFYPFPSSASVVAKANIMVARKAGKKKLAIVYCAESPVCKDYANVLTDQLKDAGEAPVATVQISATAPNFSAACVQSQSKQADVMYVNDATNIVESVVRDCARQGYRPVQLLGEAAKDYLSSKNFENALVVSFTFNDFQQETQAQRDFTAAMSAFASGAPTSGAVPPSFWASGQLFAAAMSTVKGAATPALVRSGMARLGKVTLGGLLPPTTFTPGHVPQQACFFVAGIHNQKFTSPYGTTPLCTS